MAATVIEVSVVVPMVALLGEGEVAVQGDEIADRQIESTADLLEVLGRLLRRQVDIDTTDGGLDFLAGGVLADASSL